jgi:quercetin dioxygenase-like cupin family protein
MNAPWIAGVARRWSVPMAVGIVIGAAAMQGLHAQAPPVARSVLLKTDLTGVEGKEVYMTLIEAQPGAGFPAHTHSGDEYLFVIEGAIDTFVGEQKGSVQAGGVFHAPREKLHGGTVNAGAKARLLAVHVVDKGRPFLEPAKK